MDSWTFAGKYGAALRWLKYKGLVVQPKRLGLVLKV